MIESLQGTNIKPNLEPAKKVLKALVKEIESIQEARKDFTPSMLATIENETPNSRWEKEDAYSWLYATPQYYSFLPTSRKSPTPDFYLKPALPFYNRWKDSEKDVIYRGEIIPEPQNAILIEYL